MFALEWLETWINAAYLNCLISGKCQLDQAYLKHANESNEYPEYRKT